MNKDRNDLLAGLLVIVAIIGVVAGVIMLAGFREVLGKQTYIVRFDLSENIGGLEPGAAVRLGGRGIGVVDKVTFAYEDGATEPTGTDVAINIDSDLQIREGAIVFLELPIFGAQGVINFIHLGDTATLPPGSVIRGAIAPPGFLAQAGWGEDEKTNLSHILDNVRDFSAKINTGYDRFNDGIFTDVETVTSDVRENWPEWSTRVDSITRNTDETIARGPELADTIDARLDQFEQALATAQAYLDENRENVRIAIEEFRSLGEKGNQFADHINDELVDLAKTFMEDAVAAIEGAKAVITDVSQIIGEERPNIRRSLANFRLASDQLRDTLLEVRRAPWRLLYRPDTRELEFELLYDSARSYAGAVSDLRAATESLESVMASNRDRQALSQGDIEALVQEIDRAFARYRQAEEQFLDQLIKQSPDAGN